MNKSDARVTRYRDQTGRKRWQPTLAGGRKLWYRRWDHRQVWSEHGPGDSQGWPILCRFKLWALVRARLKIRYDRRQFHRG